MRSGSLFRLGFSVLCSASLASAQMQAHAKPTKTSTVITVDVSKPLPFKIPSTIFGTFLEPIGNSTYGGLWADALTNPSFEENLWSARRIAEMIKEEPALARSSALGLPLPWEPLDYAQGARYEPRWNDAANSFRSLLIMALPGKETGIRQKSLFTGTSCPALQRERLCQTPSAALDRWRFRSASGTNPISSSLHKLSH